MPVAVAAAAAVAVAVAAAVEAPMAAMVAAVVAAASCLRRWSLAVQARELGRCEEAATLAKRRSLSAPPAQIGGWVLRGCFRRGWLGPALASGLKVGSCAAVPVPQAAPQQFGDTAQRPPAPPAVCSQAAPPAGGARGRRVWLPEWCGCQHAMCSPCRSQHLCSSSAPPAGGQTDILPEGKHGLHSLGDAAQHSHMVGPHTCWRRVWGENARNTLRDFLSTLYFQEGPS